MMTSPAKADLSIHLKEIKRNKTKQKNTQKGHVYIFCLRNEIL